MTSEIQPEVTGTEAEKPAQLTNEQLQQRFVAMKAQARRELKRLSKNELVRIVISQLIEAHQMREALKEAGEALESGALKAETDTTPQPPQETK